MPTPDSTNPGGLPSSTAKSSPDPAAQPAGERKLADVATALWSDVLHYLHAQWDLACLTASSLVWRLVLALVAGALLAAASVTLGIIAMIYLMSGLAGAIAALAGHRAWVGHLFAGGLVLFVFGGGLGCAIWRLQHDASRKLRAKYDTRKSSPAKSSV